MTDYGYACVSQLLKRTTNRTCRLNNATPARLRELITANLDDLEALLQHNVAHGWRLFRIGSALIPFASHPTFSLDWQAEFGDRLAEIGAYAHTHNLRLSMHPGQYTVLNTPRADTLAASQAELAYSAHVLDGLGLDSRHKIVLHVGGIYGDKNAALDRFVTQARALPDFIRARLVVEHDDRQYTLAEALRAGQAAGLPVVYDNLHDAILPSPEPAEALLPAVFATWQAQDGPPKIHFSSQAAGERPGKHAVDADPAEFSAVLARCEAVGDFDLMLEAKGKDAALQKVLQALASSENETPR